VKRSRLTWAPLSYRFAGLSGSARRGFRSAWRDRPANRRRRRRRRQFSVFRVGGGGKLRPRARIRIRNIFENMMDGVLVANPLTGRFRVANQTICQMLGYSESEMLGFSLEDIHPAESLRFVLDQFRKATEGNVSSVIDIPLRHKDGTVFFVGWRGYPGIHLGEYDAHQR
jgi:PAS domain S-box-containing protein